MVVIFLSKLENNLKLYNFYSIFTELLIVGPVIVLILMQKGLSFSEITLLQAISALAVVLFDIPTGAFADKFGKKYSMFLGAVSWGVALLIYAFFTDFLHLAFAEVLFGLGISFKSGAASALIYDSLKGLGRELDFQKIEGRAMSIIFFSQAFGSILAGFAFKMNINLPLIISACFMAFTALISLFFTEPVIERIVDVRKGSFFTQIKESAKYIQAHPKIKGVIFHFMFFYVFLRSSFWLYQPYMESIHIPVEYFGFIFFAFNITASLASNRVSVFVKYTKPRTMAVVSSLLISSFFILGVTTTAFGVLAILLQQVARGIYLPLISKYINKHTISQRRTTVLSFNTFAGNILYALSIPTIGILKDNTNLHTTLVVLGSTMFVITLITLQYLKKKMIKNCKGAASHNCILNCIPSSESNLNLSGNPPL